MREIVSVCVCVCVCERERERERERKRSDSLLATIIMTSNKAAKRRVKNLVHNFTR